MTLQRYLSTLMLQQVFVEGDDIAVILTATSTSNTQQTIMVDFQAMNTTGTYLNYTNSLIEIITAPNITTDKSVSIPTSEVASSFEGAINLTIIPTIEYDAASTTPKSVKVIAKEDLPEVNHNPYQSCYHCRG